MSLKHLIKFKTTYSSEYCQSVTASNIDPLMLYIFITNIVNSFFFSIKRADQSGSHSSTYFPVSSHYNYCYHCCCSCYSPPVSSFACNFLS